MMTRFTPGQRRWITVFATLLLAFLSGHLMQTSRADRAAERPPAAAIAVPESPMVTASLRPPARLSERIRETRAERKGGCDPHLELAETPAGFLAIALNAPCHLRTPLILEVNDLTASDVTDAGGRWEARLPALAREVTIRITLADRTVSGRLVHERAATQQHVILAWNGSQTFHIRTDARAEDEIGPSRIRPQATTDPGPAGTFTRVGNGTGASFEIFTFPAKPPGQGGVVRVSVDARVTEENCGKLASTRAYQTGFLGKLRPTEIAYTMPECDRVGDVVRLQNLFRDMRLAER